MDEDISILKENLRNLETKLYEILKIHTEAIVILNPETGILFSNPAAEKLFGNKPENLLNKLAEFSLVSGEKKEVSIISESDNENHLAEMRVLDFCWNGEKALLVSFHDVMEQKREEIAIKREAWAYDQGKLEILDTILHNVGNAINSVAIGIGTIQEKIANNKLTRHLVSLANAVKEHQDNFSDYVENDPQGQKVAPFIIALADNFLEHDAELSKILCRVHERTEHIADIIRTQKIISRQSLYKKNIDLKEAIDNAISVLQDPINKMHIQININLKNAPKEISTQESEFHQMLVNLIKNSVEAIGEFISSKALEELPFIKISSYTEDNCIILKIIDNGIGIEKEKLELIFRPGYTTKKQGSGFGLHSIANFINGSGGNIVALSDGIGKGATMEIKLPLL